MTKLVWRKLESHELVDTGDIWVNSNLDVNDFFAAEKSGHTLQIWMIHPAHKGRTVSDLAHAGYRAWRLIAAWVEDSPTYYTPTVEDRKITHEL